MAQLPELQQQAAKYISQQKYSEAITLYSQCIEASPYLMANYWYLGLALLLQGNEAEAQVTWLSAMVEGEPEQLEAKQAELIKLLAAEAQRHKTARELKSAWLIYQSIYELGSRGLNNLLALIWLEIQLGEFDIQENLILNEATLLILQEEFHEREVDRQLLGEVLSKIIELNSEHDFLEACFKSKVLITSLDFNVNNKLLLVYNNIGRIMYEEENFEQAVTHFQKVLDINAELTERELASIRFNIGMGLMKQEKLESAAIIFQKVLDLNPDFTEAYYYFYKARSEVHNKAKGYQFSSDWFSRNIKIWEKYLKRLANASAIKMLEIGSWEGRSTCWMLDNILTHELARITCIDTFEGSLEHKQWYEDSYINSIEKRFDFNISRSRASEKVQKIVGKSQHILRSLPLNSYDIVYIDGSHLASDVLTDAVLCWELVKIGGAIIFDDYDFVFQDNPAQNTKVGIDAFLTSFCDKIKVIHKSYQVIIEKTSA